MATQIRGSLILSIGCVFYASFPCFAQVTGVNGTTVTTSGSVLTITGGQLSGSKTNLFHGFQDFNLGAGLTANFDATPGVGNPAIANIFARVLGGSASYIDGVINVSHGTSNLFFINPAGILTGVNSRIEVPGSFTATTADRIGFAGGFLDILGSGSVAGLEGSPTAFQFSLPQAGAIVHEGTIKVGPNTSTSTGNGQGIRLMGGTVLNTGALIVPKGEQDIAPGKVEITAVKGPETVSFGANGALIQPGGTGPAPLLTLKLPSALLNGRVPQAASQITVAADGSVSLSGSPIDLAPGAVVLGGNQDVLFDDRLAVPVKGLALNGALLITAQGNVRVAAVKVDDGSNRSSSNSLRLMRAPIVIQSEGNIQTGKLGTTESDLVLIAQGDIVTGNLEAGGGGTFNNQSRTTLRSTNGSIQVDSIDSGSGGILVQANQSFRALGITPNGIRGGVMILLMILD
jgi:filamentous hemagglutinin family protein